MGVAEEGKFGVELIGSCPRLGGGLSLGGGPGVGNFRDAD